jgi:predicted Rossmann fold nucleotide-binding protein DprA/Smf involved in DNA uptake
MGITMVQNRALDVGAHSKPPKNRHLDDDAAYVMTPAERRVAAHAVDALTHLRVLHRQGRTPLHAAHLAGRFGWAYRTAIAALEHLEASGAVRCVSRRGRAMWALTA